MFTKYLRISNPADPASDFQRIADQLMNHFVLTAGSSRYRLTEIEFYYYNQENHPDPYSHRADIQKESGKWYFHGSGIDITFGDGVNYGGILLRAISKLVDGKVSKEKSNYTYGPLKLITELFSNFEDVNERDISFGISPALQREIEEEAPLAATRIGLNKNFDDKERSFHKMKYRYMVMLRMEHKEKEKLRRLSREEGMNKEEIKVIYGW